MKFTMSMKSKHIQTLSRLFQPCVTSPAKVDSGKATSLSQKLMLAAGIIHQAHNGLFHLLPLGTRALKKLTMLVEGFMENDLGAQRVCIPSLTSADLWKLTGRLELAGVELFKLMDRHKKEFILAPTHEESITNLLATVPLISHRDLPLLLYQISNKYRDEMRPRYGLIRSKEFLMKDLYSFDKNHETAINTYSKVCKTYENIFNKIGVSYLKVTGDTGLMGGSYSHEYHFPAKIGDDTLVVCSECNFNWNENVFSDENVSNDVCKKCSSSNLKRHRGIEVGHTFLLGTKYSSVLKAQFNSDGQQREDLVMGSFGLGLTRIVSAALEVLSTPNELRWPRVFAPYSVIVITPKDGSKESATADSLLNDLCRTLQSIDHVKDDILIDDRNHLTIGRRLAEAKLVGYPNIIVIGKTCLGHTPTYEYLNVYDNLNAELTFECLIDQINNCSGQNIIDSETVRRRL